MSPRDGIHLDYDSNYDLGITHSYGKYINIEISKARRLTFYWNHPEHSLRIGFRLGIIGLFLGLLGFIIGLISGIC